MYRLKRESTSSTDGKVTVQADKNKFKINIDGKSTQATRSGYNLVKNSNKFKGACSCATGITGSLTNEGYQQFDVETGNGNWTTRWFYSINQEIKENLSEGDTFTIMFTMRRTEGISNPPTIYIKKGMGYYSMIGTLSTEFSVVYYTGTWKDKNGIIPHLGFGGLTGTFIIKNWMIKKGGLEEWEDYGASPSPEFQSEIHSVGDDVNLWSLNNSYTTTTGSEYVLRDTTIKTILAGTYTLSLKKSVNSNVFFTFKDSSNKQTDIYLNGVEQKTITFESDIVKVAIYIYGTQECTISNIKLQKGMVATPYSEYGKGTVTIEQRGKNEFDIDSEPSYKSGIPSYSKLINGVRVISNLTGNNIYCSIVYKLKDLTNYVGKVVRMKCNFVESRENIGAYIVGLCNKDCTSRQMLQTGLVSGQEISFVVPELNDKKYLAVWLYSSYNGIANANDYVDYTDIIVTIDNEDMTYEPYFSKDYVLQTAPLRSLPNGTKDTIEEDGIHRRVGSVVLDGSENWIFGTQYQPQFGNRFDVSLPNLPGAGSYEILCNYFKYIEPNKGGCWANISSKLELRIQTTMFSTVTELKTWLSTHNTEVIYELSEEVVEPFTDEQLEVIDSMITEKGTNIFDINEDTRITINYTPEFTDEIKHAFRYGVTRGYLEVLDGSELIINEDNYLQSIDFDDERYVDGEGIIGSTVAKSLEGKFVNVDSEFSVENKELQAYIGAELDDGTTKYIDLGTFIVQKPDNDNVKDNTSFTSLDYMVKFNQTYKDTITYPCTLGQLLQNVCEQVGIVLGTKTFRNSNFLVENNQFVNNESCREVLKAIAQMAFSWARINQDNELVLDFNLIDEPTAEFDYDEYYDLTSNEQYGPVNTIILKNSQVEGENYTVKNQDLIDEAGKEIALTISDNPFAYTQAKRSQLIQAGKELFGFKYIPFTAKTIGYIYLNCQDKIRIKNMQNKLLDSYLFNNKFSYEGSISDNKETSAMTETETKYQFTDTVEKKLNAKIARTEIIVDKANQEITAVVEKQTEYDKSLTEIKAGLGSVTSTVEEIKNFKRSKRSTNEIYITDAMEDGTLSFTAIGNESVNVVLFPLNNLYPSDDLYGGNEYDG